ncbi:hypothetical protein BH10ACT8_BH10ACT8_04590 [soil metagenome]
MARGVAIACLISRTEGGVRQVSKRQFTPAERYAVFTVHGAKCYMCSEPLNLKEFQVDHVVPESLLETPDERVAALTNLGCPDAFEINSFENWLPSCGPWNNRKRSRVWNPSPLMQLNLQYASDGAPKARALAASMVTKQAVANALNTLERLEEQGALTDEIKAQFAPIVGDYSQNIAPEADHDVVRLTPTYAAPLYEVLSDNGLSKVVRGPYGIGGGPSDRDHPVAPQMNCGVCGYPYFSGARCVICATMNDGD